MVDFLRRHVDSVREIPGVHAKLVVGDGAALVGSANLTRRAICDRVEMACLIREPALLGELVEWFESIWAAAEDVGEARLSRLDGSGRPSTSAPKPASDSLAPRPYAARGSLGWLAGSATAQRGPDIGPRAVSSDLGKETARLAEKLRHILSTRSEAICVLRTMREALDTAGLEVDDDRLHLNFGRRRVRLAVGQRNICWLRRRRPGGQARPYLSLLLDDFEIAHAVTETLEGSYVSAFTRSRQPNAPALHVPVAAISQLPREARESWHGGIRVQVESAGASGYRRHKRCSLYYILRDEQTIEQAALLAFPREPS